MVCDIREGEDVFDKIALHADEGFFTHGVP